MASVFFLQMWYTQSLCCMWDTKLKRTFFHVTLNTVVQNSNYKFTDISFIMDESLRKWRPSDVH